MKRACIFILAFCAFTRGVFGQDGVPAIKARAVSAFVWGEYSTSGAISSTIQDPLTGNVIHTLSYAGIEVSSRIGFERLGTEPVGSFLNYTTIVVNGTDTALSVRYGGISVDGLVASPLWVVPAGQKLSKKEHQRKPDAMELEKIHCLTSGFLSSDNLFSANVPAQVFTVVPRSSLTVSSIVRDPRRYHSFQCSVDGCFPTGTIRYYLTVNTKDFVFIWPARSAVYCGA